MIDGHKTACYHLRGLLPAGACQQCDKAIQPFGCDDAADRLKAVRNGQWLRKALCDAHAHPANLFDLREKMRRKLCFDKQHGTPRFDENIADRGADNALRKKGAEKIAV